MKPLWTPMPTLPLCQLWLGFNSTGGSTLTSWPWPDQLVSSLYNSESLPWRSNAAQRTFYNPATTMAEGLGKNTLTATLSQQETTFGENMYMHLYYIYCHHHSSNRLSLPDLHLLQLLTGFLYGLPKYLHRIGVSLTPRCAWKSHYKGSLSNPKETWT